MNLVALDSTGEFSSEQPARMQERRNLSRAPRYRTDLRQMEMTLVELGLHAFILHSSTSTKIVHVNRITGITGALYLRRRNVRFRHLGTIGYFRVDFCLCVKTSLRVKPFTRKCVLSTGSFSFKSNSFSHERFCTKTRFETEVNGNSEMTY